MLLIEGPDMTGKTTLAEKVRAALYGMKKPVAAMKFGMESKGVMSVEHLRHRIHRWTVCDRMHPSEVIYALARGEKPRLSPADVITVGEMMTVKRGMTVVIYADDAAYERLIELHHDRGEDYSKEACRAVNKMYRTLARTGMVAANYSFGQSQLVLEIGLSGDNKRVEYVSDDQAKAIAATYAALQEG